MKACVTKETRPRRHSDDVRLTNGQCHLAANRRLEDTYHVFKAYNNENSLSKGIKSTKPDPQSIARLSWQDNRPTWEAQEKPKSWWVTGPSRWLREQNKQNRASDCSGLGSSLHTGGSVPHTEHRRRLKKHLGREPTPLELHTRTHQHQADHQWVDEKSRKTHDDFVRVRESRQSTGEGSSSRSAHISEYQTWSEVVGGRQRGRVYGMGSQAFAIEGSSYTSAFHDPSGAEESVSERIAALTREIEEMKRVQSREIEEMRKVQNEMQAELQSYRAEK
ncbi:hypothetical protein KFK09_009330 [Dendrobium nobile]|uniref:Uncharacterized protein n=1 Tax=Dendrobium nobile TaxID=94219 RepID=A0A8T3BT84_DENNO|nr:hypothetical protein KFK09_009330 [Dendrobium nobile]